MKIVNKINFINKFASLKFLEFFMLINLEHYLFKNILIYYKCYEVKLENRKVKVIIKNLQITLTVHEYELE